MTMSFQRIKFKEKVKYLKLLSVTKTQLLIRKSFPVSSYHTRSDDRNAMLTSSRQYNL